MPGSNALYPHALVAQQVERVSRKDEVARSIRARGSANRVLVLQLVERPARDAGRCGFESRRAHEGARRSGRWTVLGRFRAASRARPASLAQLDKRNSPVPRRVPVRTRQEALVRPLWFDPSGSILRVSTTRRRSSAGMSVCMVSRRTPVRSRAVAPRDRGVSGEHAALPWL